MVISSGELLKSLIERNQFVVNQRRQAIRCLLLTTIGWFRFWLRSVA
jgi:hypothetical protein